MENDFEEILNKFLNHNHTVDYDFIKDWVGKGDGILNIDGITLSTFKKGSINYKLMVWMGNYHIDFEGETLNSVVYKALLHLSGNLNESNKTAVQIG